jgi:hypothetical protein
MDKATIVSKAHVSNVFFSKKAPFWGGGGIIFAPSGENLLICKSKTSLGKAKIIFSDSMVASGLEEGLSGFQLFKSAAPNSSMAPSYEHSSV